MLCKAKTLHSTETLLPLCQILMLQCVTRPCKMGCFPNEILSALRTMRCDTWTLLSGSGRQTLIAPQSSLADEMQPLVHSDREAR